MEAIILAGGFGTRLQQIVTDLPKPMAPIEGRPFLEIVLANLARKGIKRVIFSLGYMAESISSYFGNAYAGISLEYVIEDIPLGTGGGIRLAMDSCLEDHVYIFNGDTFLDLEIEKIESHWQLKRQPIIIGRQVSDTSRYGRLITDDTHVVGLSEKGTAGPGLINAGCYILCHDQLNDFPLNAAFSFENDYLAKTIRDKIFELFVTNGYFIDIGMPEDYARAQIELISLPS